MTAPIVEHADQVIVRAGFLDESPGVRSSTRLIMVWLTVLASIVVLTIVFYVVYCVTRRPTPMTPDQFIILALVGALSALVINGSVAIAKRNGGEQ